MDIERKVAAPDLGLHTPSILRYDG
jgi:hypothetical protein